MNGQNHFVIAVIPRKHLDANWMCCDVNFNFIREQTLHDRINCFFLFRVLCSISRAIRASRNDRQTIVRQSAHTYPLTVTHTHTHRAFILIRNFERLICGLLLQAVIQFSFHLIMTLFEQRLNITPNSPDDFDLLLAQK